MRLFVAVPLPASFKLALRAYAPRYPENFVRFVPENNLHLTLHFIGEVPENSLEDILTTLSAVAGAHLPFTLHFQETAPGPQRRSPRLIWTRFAEHPAFAALSTSLCKALDAAPGAFGKFIPHITIARLRKGGDQHPHLPLFQDSIIPNLAVTEMALWQSFLQSPHPEYRILKTFPLTGT